MPHDADRLSDLSTCTLDLLNAGPDVSDGERASALKAARTRLFEYYEPTVRRYLHGLLRNRPDREHRVEELFNEFALRFCQGRFAVVANRTGRFRVYLREVLRNLAADVFRERPDAPLADGYDAPDARPGGFEAAFDAAWRRGLLDRSLERLRERKPVRAAVLAAAVEYPDLSARALLPHLAGLLPADVTDPEGWVRTQLSRARREFGACLRDEVRAGLTNHSGASLEAELKECRVWDFCKDAGADG